MTSVEVDAGTPRIEVQRLASGAHAWRVVVIAADSSEASLRAAKDLAVKIDRELAVHYDPEAK